MKQVTKALLLLTLLLCLGIAQTALAGSYDAQLRDWMQYIPDNVQLSQINMPGAHDAGTFSINTFAKIWGQCQWDGNTIYDQMKDGTRVFDIRLRPGAKSNPVYGLEVNHGGWTCDTGFLSGVTLTLGHVMDDVQRFLAEHPTETAVIIVTDEVPGSGSEKEENKQFVKNAFDQLKKWYPPFKPHASSVRWASKFYYFQKGDVVPTLGQMRGKCVIIDDYDTLTMYENNWDVYASDKKPYVDSVIANAVRQNWVEADRDLFVRENYRNQTNPGNPSVMMFYTSCNAGFWEGPNTSSTSVNKHLQTKTLTPGRRLGWMMMDFPYEANVKQVIGSNMPTVEYTFAISSNTIEQSEFVLPTEYRLYGYSSYITEAVLIADESCGRKFQRIGSSAQLVFNLPMYDGIGEEMKYFLIAYSRYTNGKNVEFHHRADSGTTEKTNPTWLNHTAKKVSIPLSDSIYDYWSFSLQITWDDDNNKEGKRPQNTAEFIKLFGGVQVQKSNKSGNLPDSQIYIDTDSRSGAVSSYAPYLEYIPSASDSNKGTLKIRGLQNTSHRIKGFPEIPFESPYVIAEEIAWKDTTTSRTTIHLRENAPSVMATGHILWYRDKDTTGERLFREALAEFTKQDGIIVNDYYKDKLYDTYTVTMKDSNYKWQDRNMMLYELPIRNYGQGHLSMLTFPEKPAHFVQIGGCNGRDNAYSQEIEVTSHIWFNKEEYASRWKARVEAKTDSLRDKTIQVNYLFTHEETDENGNPRIQAVTRIPKYDIDGRERKIELGGTGRDQERKGFYDNFIYYSSTFEDYGLEKYYLLERNYITADGVPGIHLAKSVYEWLNSTSKDLGHKDLDRGEKGLSGDNPFQSPIMLSPGTITDISSSMSGILQASILSPLSSFASTVPNDEAILVGIETNEIAYPGLPAAEKNALNAALTKDEKITRVLDITLNTSVYEDQNHDGKISDDELIYMYSAPTTSAPMTVQLDYSDDINLLHIEPTHFGIIRIHEGKAERIPTLHDAKAKTITFVSDQFSTYVLTSNETPDAEAVNVRIVWKNRDKNPLTIPKQVKVTLSNGSANVGTIPVAKSGSWNGTFTDCPAYQLNKGNLELIPYTVAPEAVEDFYPTVTGDAQNGFVITFAAVPPLPQTGDNSSLPLTLGTLALSLGALVLLMRKRKAA